MTYFSRLMRPSRCKQRKGDFCTRHKGSPRSSYVMTQTSAVREPACETSLLLMFLENDARNADRKHI